MAQDIRIWQDVANTDRFEVTVPLGDLRARVPWGLDLGGSGEAPQLQWWRPQHEDFKEGQSLHGCVWRFIDLYDAPDTAILVFARRYGVLGVCEHGQPGVHSRCFPHIWEVRPGEEPGQSIRWSADPLATWRRYSRMLAGLAGVGLALYWGESPPLGDWANVYGIVDAHGTVAEVASKASPLWQKRTLAQIMTRIMTEDAGIYPCLDWPSSEQGTPARLLLGLAGPRQPGHGPHSIDPPGPAGTLFSTVVAQLAAALTHPDRIYVCSQCGSRFEPELQERTPRRDRRVLCGPDCRAKAARGRKRDWARRNHTTTKVAAS
jgi:DNA-directed RNA polymerase subunit RPC12/RpoP